MKDFIELSVKDFSRRFFIKKLGIIPLLLGVVFLGGCTSLKKGGLADTSKTFQNNRSLAMTEQEVKKRLERQLEQDEKDRKVAEQKRLENERKAAKAERTREKLVRKQDIDFFKNRGQYEKARQLQAQYVADFPEEAFARRFQRRAVRLAGRLLAPLGLGASLKYVVDKFWPNSDENWAKKKLCVSNLFLKEQESDNFSAPERIRIIKALATCPSREEITDFCKEFSTSEENIESTADRTIVFMCEKITSPLEDLKGAKLQDPAAEDLKKMEDLADAVKEDLKGLTGLKPVEFEDPPIEELDEKKLKRIGKLAEEFKPDDAVAVKEDLKGLQGLTGLKPVEFEDPPIEELDEKKLNQIKNTQILQHFLSAPKKKELKDSSNEDMKELADAVKEALKDGKKKGVRETSVSPSVSENLEESSASSFSLEDMQKYTDCVERKFYKEDSSHCPDDLSLQNFCTRERDKIPYEIGKLCEALYRNKIQKITPDI